MSDAKIIQQRRQTFMNYYMRKTLNIKWQDKTRNKEVWERARQELTRIQIKSRKRRWIGHILRKQDSSITSQGLTWNPQGNRSQGRSRTAWRTNYESAQRQGKEVEKKSKIRDDWRNLIRGLYSQWNEGALMMMLIMCYLVSIATFSLRCHKKKQ